MLSLITSVVSGVTGWFTRGQKHKIAIEEATVKARIKMIEKEAEATTNADLEAIKAQRYSLKDEWLMAIGIAPFVGCFIPGLQPYVSDGFKILSTTPEWYQVLVIGMYVSVFGLRFMMKRFFGGK